MNVQTRTTIHPQLGDLFESVNHPHLERFLARCLQEKPSSWEASVQEACERDALEFLERFRWTLNWTVLREWGLASIGGGLRAQAGPDSTTVIRGLVRRMARDLRGRLDL